MLKFLSKKHVLFLLMVTLVLIQPLHCSNNHPTLRQFKEDSDNFIETYKEKSMFDGQNATQNYIHMCFEYCKLTSLFDYLDSFTRIGPRSYVYEVKEKSQDVGKMLYEIDDKIQETYETASCSFFKLPVTGSLFINNDTYNQKWMDIAQLINSNALTITNRQPFIPWILERTGSELWQSDNLMFDLIYYTTLLHTLKPYYDSWLNEHQATKVSFKNRYKQLKKWKMKQLDAWKQQLVLCVDLFEDATDTKLMGNEAIKTVKDSLLLELMLPYAKTLSLYALLSSSIFGDIKNFLAINETTITKVSSDLLRSLIPLLKEEKERFEIATHNKMITVTRLLKQGYKIEDIAGKFALSYYLSKCFSISFHDNLVVALKNVDHKKISSITEAFDTLFLQPRETDKDQPQGFFSKKAILPTLLMSALTYGVIEASARGITPEDFWGYIKYDLFHKYQELSADDLTRIPNDLFYLFKTTNSVRDFLRMQKRIIRPFAPHAREVLVEKANNLIRDDTSFYKEHLPENYQPTQKEMYTLIFELFKRSHVLPHSVYQESKNKILKNYPSSIQMRVEHYLGNPIMITP